MNSREAVGTHTTLSYAAAHSFSRFLSNVDSPDDVFAVGGAHSKRGYESQTAISADGQTQSEFLIKVISDNI